MNRSTSGVMKEGPSLVTEQKTTEVHTSVK
jgi:hypothetical protein